MQHNTQVPVGKHNNRQHASPHHEVATDVKQMPIRPIIIIIMMSLMTVIKWKHFPRYWPFVQGIHWSPMNFLHIGQWRGALMFSLIYVWINGWANNRETGDLRRHHVHDNVIVMENSHCKQPCYGFLSLFKFLRSQTLLWCLSLIVK